MQIVDNLLIKDFDLVIHGDVKLVGRTRIVNASLIVDGDIIFCPSDDSEVETGLSIEGGNLAVNGIIRNEIGYDNCCKYLNVDGVITATSVFVNYIDIKDIDIQAYLPSQKFLCKYVSNHCIEIGCK